ncbi:MAG: hypothetical protein ACRD16_04475 [Thermoanaerobaculia bacterium]
MKKLFRPAKDSRARLETFKAAPSVDAVTETGAHHIVSKPRHTDLLAIARRKNQKPSASPPAGPAVAAPVADPKPKTGKWWHFRRSRKVDPSKR